MNLYYNNSLVLQYSILHTVGCYMKSKMGKQPYCPQCPGTAMTDHRDSVAVYSSVRFIAILVLSCCCNGQVFAQDSRGQGDV